MVSDECLNSIQLPRAESAIVGKRHGLDPELTSHSVPFNMDMGRFDAIEAGEEDLIGAVDTPHARHEIDPIRTRSRAAPGLGDASSRLGGPGPRKIAAWIIRSGSTRISSRGTFAASLQSLRQLNPKIPESEIAVRPLPAVDDAGAGRIAVAGGLVVANQGLFSRLAPRAPPRRRITRDQAARDSFSSVFWITPSPCSIMPVTKPQSSSGNTSAIQTKRQRPGPSSNTWAEALW